MVTATFAAGSCCAGVDTDEVGYVAGLAKNKRSNHLITPLKDEAVVDLVFGQVEIPSFDSSTAV